MRNKIRDKVCTIMASDKTEKAEIARDGGTPQKNSGRGKIQKGDAILYPFCVDIKEYEKTFGLSRSVWVKVTSDAIKSGSYEPALKIVLGTESQPKLRLWVIDDAMFHQMLDAWKAMYCE